MRNKIIDWLSDDQYSHLFNTYNKDNCMKQYTNSGNSWYYYIPIELVITEAPNWRLTKTPVDEWDNWISNRLFYKVLDTCCNLSPQQYFDLMILHIMYEEDRPKCAECGTPLEFMYIRGGYGHHSLEYQDKLFCSNSCKTTYNNKLGLVGFSKSNEDIFINKGNPTDICYLYIAHTATKLKYGITSDLESRVRISNSFNNDPYLDIIPVFETSRVKVAEFEAFLKSQFNNNEYLEKDQEPLLRKLIEDNKYRYKINDILIFSVHLDDEILAFGGYMVDQIAAGNRIHVRYGTAGGVHKLQDHDTRMKEAESVMNSLLISDWDVYFHNMDAMMDTIPQREIACKMDADLDKIKPDEVFCCYPSTHQDHIAMYNAFMISMRLRDGFMPPFVALGEYPFILTSKTLPEGGSFYHPLSEETLKRKIELFEMYKTQLRPSPSPLGSHGIEVLAQTRGIECGHTYAEKFYLQKLVR